MRSSLPGEVTALFEQVDDASRDHAWARFLEIYSALMISTARRLGGGNDEIMDRYEFVIGQLRRDDCQRLRRYAADGRGQFTTWLVLVTQRLCLDYHRHRYGRLQRDSADGRDEQAARRRLVDLVGDEILLDEIAGSGDDPETTVRVRELSTALLNTIATLPITDRLLLKLRFEDELTVPEITRITRAQSAAHVYRQLDRIFAHLQRLLRTVGVEDSRP